MLRLHDHHVAPSLLAKFNKQRGNTLDQLVGTPLNGTEGANNPFFSLDGAWVGYQSGPGGPLKKVSVLGGPSLTLCALDAMVRGASWGADDTIIFAIGSEGTGLFHVAAAGGGADSRNGA